MIIICFFSILFNVLTSGYTVQYTNNKSVETATMTVTGIGNFTGSFTTTFSILQDSQKSQSITASTVYTKTYSSSEFALDASTTGNGMLREIRIAFKHMNL